MSAGLALRPQHAFGLIGCVFAAAAAVLGKLAFAGADSSSREICETAPPPRFEIADRTGKLLARSLERLDLILSPNAMWQAHTPEVIAEAIAAASAEGAGPALERAALFELLLPDAAREGFVRVTSPRLDGEQAARIERWARAGRLDERPVEPPFDGIWIESSPEGFELCWDPRTVLSLASRAAHDVAKYPLSWTRRLADRIAQCLWAEQALAIGDDERALEAQRQRVWDFLMPAQYSVVAADLDPSAAAPIYRALVEQGVAEHQMRIERSTARVHPAGDLDVLGAWTFPSAAEAEARAAETFGVADAAAVPAARRGAFEIAVGRLLAERWPRSGLERAAARLFEEREDAALTRPAQFSYRRDKPARQRSRAYFQDARPGELPPRFVATLDLDLQRSVRRALEALLAEHEAALAQAIVFEVESGDVLALDAVCAYPSAGFAPLQHCFTPGSTFKVLVMAAALDAGVCRPDQVFDVGHDPYPLVDPSNGSVRRRIHEAESTRHGLLSAAECLAYSSNRGMTQIGLQLEAGPFRERLLALGYGARPDSGLGGERGGWLPPLPWKPWYTQASLCFGHEVATTLWQHAEALAAVLRGGLAKPLRLLAEVEDGGRRFALPASAGVRVFGAQACAEVREMLRMGAREGTGSSVASPEKLPGLDVGTKTGTAEKVGTEICLHAELAHRADGHACSVACRKTLAGERPEHSSCYTSSMLLVAREADGEPGAEPAEAREIAVLIVVDEPRGLAKYGSRVAGPAAAAIALEALGRTRHGLAPLEDWRAGFALGERSSENTSLAPWSEGEW